MDFGCWIWMCEYITNEQLFRQLDEPFIPKVNSLSLAAFFCYCFDCKFQAKFTKPFTISNYLQKLINKFENSSFIKDHYSFKKLLREAAKFANHYRGESIISIKRIQLYWLIILIQE